MLIHLCGEDLNSDFIELDVERLDIVGMELEIFYLKTWHLIMTEAPVQMPLL